jgi:hypothetical protein
MTQEFPESRLFGNFAHSVQNEPLVPREALRVGYGGDDILGGI